MGDNVFYFLADQCYNYYYNVENGPFFSNFWIKQNKIVRSPPLVQNTNIPVNAALPVGGRKRKRRVPF